MAKVLPWLLLHLAFAASTPPAVSPTSCKSSLDQTALLTLLQGPPESWLPSPAVRRLENVSSCKEWDLHRACPGNVGHVVSMRECRDFAEGEVIDLSSFGPVGGSSAQGTCICFERCACGTRYLKGKTLSLASTVRFLQSTKKILGFASSPKKAEPLSGGAICGVVIGSLLGAWFILRFAVAHILARALEEERVLRHFPQSNDFSTGPFDICADKAICIFGCCFPYELAAVNAHRAGLIPFWISWLRLVLCGPFYILPEIRAGLRHISGMPPQNTCRECLLVQFCCWCTACQEARHIQEAYNTLNKTSPDNSMPASNIGHTGGM